MAQDGEENEEEIWNVWSLSVDAQIFQLGEWLSTMDETVKTLTESLLKNDDLKKARLEETLGHFREEFQGYMEKTSESLNELRQNFIRESQENVTEITRDLKMKVIEIQEDALKSFSEFVSFDEAHSQHIVELTQKKLENVLPLIIQNHTQNLQAEMARNYGNYCAGLESQKKETQKLIISLNSLQEKIPPLISQGESTGSEIDQLRNQVAGLFGLMEKTMGRLERNEKIQHQLYACTKDPRV